MVRRIQNSPVSIPSMATVPVNRNPVRTDSRVNARDLDCFPIAEKRSAGLRILVDKPDRVVVIAAL